MPRRHPQHTDAPPPSSRGSSTGGTGTPLPGELSSGQMLLRQNEAYFRALLSAMSEGLLVFDNRGSVIAGNAAAARILDIPERALVGRTDLEHRLLSLDERGNPSPSVMAPWKLTARTGQPCRDVALALTDLDTRWISMNTLALDGGTQAVIAVFTDITRLKIVERGLKFTQHVVEHAADGVARVGPDGRFLHGNAAFCHLIGCSHTDLLTLSVSDVDEHLPVEQWRAYWDAMRDQGIRVQETVIRTRDGRHVPVELAISHQQAFGEEFHCTTIRDLTERKRAERALRESEERYRSVVSAISEGILMQDEAGLIVACNPAAERILGMPASAILQQNIAATGWMFCYEDGSPCPWQDHPVSHALRTGRSQPEVTLGLTRPDGELVWLAINAEPLIRTGESRAYAAMTSFTDITARRRTEQALRLTQFAVDHAGEGIAWVREDGSFRYVNDEFCRMLNYSRADLLKLSTLDIDRSFTRESWASLWQSLPSQSACIREAVYLSADGRRIPVELAINVATVDGQQYHCDFIRDQTEHKRAEMELRAYAGRLQDMSRRIISVSEQERRRLALELHDTVGASLATLALELKLLQQALPSRTPQAAQEQLTGTMGLLAEINHAVRSITTELRPTTLDYAGLLPALQEYARKVQSRTGLRVEVVGGTTLPDLPPETAICLFRIIQEALTNACKHAGASKARVELGTAGNIACLRIEDDGIGFDTDRLYHPGHSAGLGLLGMRERAQSIGWTFSLQSVPEGGTVILLQEPGTGRRLGDA